MNTSEKSAIVMLTLGDELAANVFKYLNTHEVKQISSAMLNLGGFTHEQIAQVLREFSQESGEYAALSLNTSEYLRNVLIKALGVERASSLLDDILDSSDSGNGIETLNIMEPQGVWELIRDEHPQIITTILVHLNRSQAADVLSKFDERARNNIMLRIATFGGVQQAQQQGLSDGQRRGRICRRRASRRALLASFQATLEQINKLIPACLLQHALTAARQIVGDSLVANPALLSDQLRRYLQEDRWLQQDAMLTIHPQDLPWVQEYLAASCRAPRCGRRKTAPARLTANVVTPGEGEGHMFVERIGGGGVVTHGIQITHLIAFAVALQIAGFFTQTVVAVVLHAALIVRHAVAVRVDLVGAGGAIAGQQLPAASGITVLPLQRQRLTYNHAQRVGTNGQTIGFFLQRKAGQAEPGQTVARTSFPGNILLGRNAPGAVQTVVAVALDHHAGQTFFQHVQAQIVFAINVKHHVVTIRMDYGPVF